MSTRRFLDALFSTCAGGVVEMRAFPSGARVWAALGDWAALGPFVTAQVRAGQNVALGIATRQDTTNGTATNLRELPALFCDLDREPDDAARRLALLPFRPSWVISSGRHVHVYFRLKEAVNLACAAERTRAIAVLRRLATHLHGDRQAADAARILRLPGSISFKYGTPRHVAVLEQHPSVINVSELDDFLPGEVVRDGVLVPDNRLVEGHRNDTLYALVRSLRWRGVPARVIVPTLDTVNREWCSPPLDTAELTRLLRYALVQGDRPDFAARHVADDIVHDAVVSDERVQTCG